MSRSKPPPRRGPHLAPRGPRTSAHPTSIDRDSASGSNAVVAAAQPLEEGSLVGGRFVAERRLASGAMGEVWVGRHRDIQSRVALKSLLPDACRNPEIVVRFRREAFFLGLVHSDHVARIYDFVPDPRHGPVLVMELVEGESLSELLKKRALTVEEGIDVGIGIAKGIRDLHRARIVHRDLKPGNVVLRAVEGRTRPVIVDFGVSRLVEEKPGAEVEPITNLTRHDVSVGTIEYMAPEQILSARDVSWPADLYALGAILYRAIAGAHAFPDLEGMDLAREKLTKSPPPLETGRTDRVALGMQALVARAMERAPADRFECADEMLAELSLLRDMALGRRDTSASDASLGPRPPAPSDTGPNKVSFSARTAWSQLVPKDGAIGYARLLAPLAAGAVLGFALASALRRPPAPLPAAEPVVVLPPAPEVPPAPPPAASARVVPAPVAWEGAFQTRTRRDVVVELDGGAASSPAGPRVGERGRLLRRFHQARGKYAKTEGWIDLGEVSVSSNERGRTTFHVEVERPAPMVIGLENGPLAKGERLRFERTR